MVGHDWGGRAGAGDGGDGGDGGACGGGGADCCVSRVCRAPPFSRAQELMTCGARARASETCFGAVVAASAKLAVSSSPAGTYCCGGADPKARQ